MRNPRRAVDDDRPRGLGRGSGDVMSRIEAAGVAPALVFASLSVGWSMLALALLYPVFRRLGPAWGAFVLVNLIPPLFAGGLLSMGRLSSTLFPLFLALAAIIAPRNVPAWVAVFGIGQGLCAALFFTWRDLY